MRPPKVMDLLDAKHEGRSGRSTSLKKSERLYEASATVSGAKRYGLDARALRHGKQRPLGLVTVYTSHSRQLFKALSDRLQVLMCRGYLTASPRGFMPSHSAHSHRAGPCPPTAPNLRRHRWKHGSACPQRHIAPRLSQCHHLQ